MIQTFSKLLTRSKKRTMPGSSTNGYRAEELFNNFDFFYFNFITTALPLPSSVAAITP